jgi:hypothetical protein
MSHYTEFYTRLLDVLAPGAVIMHVDLYTLIVWRGGSTLNVWNIDGASIDREIDAFSINTTDDDGRTASLDVLRARADRAVVSWLSDRDDEIRARNDEDFPF